MAPLASPASSHVEERRVLEAYFDVRWEYSG